MFLGSGEYPHIGSIPADPDAITDRDEVPSIPGNLPDLRRDDLPSCRFLKRCERAQEDCVSGSLPSMEFEQAHSVRCFHPL